MKILYDKEKRKELILSFAAIALIVGGYLSYIHTLNNSNLDDNQMLGTINENELHIGDVELVSSNVVSLNEIENNMVNLINSGIVPNDNENQIINNNANLNGNIILKEDLNTVDTSNPNLGSQKINEDSYFYETHLEQEKIFSEAIETYQKLIDNVQTPQDQKAIAVQEITNITNTKNGIKVAENLIKNKGFTDVVILVNNGKATVVVKKEKLFKEDISKIQNIVERELSIAINNINITNK